MTEERACHYAKVLARGMGVTFYAVRSREGHFLAVQMPSDDCEILAKVTPPTRVQPQPAIPGPGFGCAGGEAKAHEVLSR
jgi:hypothetical protein